MKFRKLTAMLLAAAMTAGLSAAAQEIYVGASLKTGDHEESAAETQRLIDNKPQVFRSMELLDRGLVAVKTDRYVYLSWRWLGTESSKTLYNIYRNGELINSAPLSATNYTDIGTDGSDGEIAAAKYSVAPVVDGVEGEKSPECSVWMDGYLDVPIEKPADNEINGEKYSYSPGDASVADLDGDGRYEIILKWDPSNAKDAAQMGYTGECIIDAYKTDGTRMWRINLGKNIRAGAHDTQFMVYDFDGDGKAEMICRTADGTMAGDGSYIGDKDKDWTNSSGKNLTGPLYLTAFRGIDGAVIDTAPYEPQTEADGKWDVTYWGDSEGNRSERYLAGIGSLDGETVSALFARGYYTGGEGPTGGRTVIAAWDLKDGKLEKRWVFDTMDYENKYIGQGNHSMSLADVDYDGCDEVIYGALAVDHDGTPMYSTGLGHGDAQHVADILPSRPGLEVYSCHEDMNAEYSYELRDARTGEILWGGEQLGMDNGRAAAADIDPRFDGDECWSAAGVLTSADGTVISDNYTMGANFMAWWDGDLGREVQDGIYIGKWNPETEKTDTIFTASGCVSVNGTKANPSLTADILGDWREEVIYPTNDYSALRIYTTNIPTAYKIPTLMHDPQYRNHVALQNTCYNQPTHLSYYLGYDTKEIPVPAVSVNGATNPDTGSYDLDYDVLFTGDMVYLVADYPVALINGMPKRVDNDNTDVVPYVDENDRTMVPLRFIAEAFGAKVSWDNVSKEASVEDEYAVIRMTAGSRSVNVTDKLLGIESTVEMDTDVAVRNDRTFVPLRIIVEALRKNVSYSDGLISVSNRLYEINAELKQAILNAPVPTRLEPEALGNGNEKFYTNQLDVFGAEASSNDGNNEAGAFDLDLTTRWSAYGANTLVADLGSEQKVTGVAIAMWKGSERIYPFTVEYSLDGESWTQALAKTQNSGTTEDFEQYDFDEPVTARYIRYSGDGATDPGKNYCHISELAVLGAE